MAVNLSIPLATDLKPIAGLALGITEAGIRKANRKDLLVIQIAQDASVAGVFTQNRFCAAPVTVCREHLKLDANGKTHIRALVINTGNANAGTGAQGMADATRTCAEVAAQLGIAPEQVLPFSTGVIMEHLPMARLLAGIPHAIGALKSDAWFDAAHAIMTTDTIAKAASRTVKLGEHTITLTGIAKGAGMIKPNMATMLGFIATDACVSQHVLEAAIKRAADLSFNSITVDGDTSTNDSFVVIATGKSTAPAITGLHSAEGRAFAKALNELAIELAQKIVRDGEGATKFITVQIDGGVTDEECRKVGYAIGHSPLTKTAFFASDPNRGRILAAIGYAGISDLDTNKIDLYLDDVLVATQGGRAASYQEADGARVMKQSEITVHVKLNRGEVKRTMWTCDFSYDYVKINADYRS